MQYKIEFLQGKREERKKNVAMYSLSNPRTKIETSSITFGNEAIKQLPVNNYDRITVRGVKKH